MQSSSGFWLSRPRDPGRDGRDFLALAARHRRQVSTTTPYLVDLVVAVLDSGEVDLSLSITGVRLGSRRRPSARYLSNHHHCNGIVRQMETVT